MSRIPDSPEGVALALVAMILGARDSSAGRDADMVLDLFRRCLAAATDTDAGRMIREMRDLTRR